MNEAQKKFKEMLLLTNREGMENVIERLEEQGFFKAPASTKFHLNYEGGLLEHSMNVCDMALELREVMIRKKEGLRDLLPKCGLQ
jgi:23S rRNA maturation-related 3'-5' exoribonuclease YhaM